MGHSRQIALLHLSIAGFYIDIKFIREEDMYEYEEIFITKVKDYYKSFISPPLQKPDYIIEIVHQRTFKLMYQNNLKDIFINLYKNISPSRIQTFFHLSGSQLQIIIRRVTHNLLVKNQGFILHGSAAKRGSTTYVFLGKSGAGKSSITRLLQDQFQIAGDDSVIIRKHAKKYSFYSSSAIERNALVPKNFKKLDLKGFFFLKKSSENKIVPIKNPQTILKLLAAQLYSEKEDIKSQFRYMNDLISSFDRFNYLYFSLNDPIEVQEMIKNI